MSYDAQNIGFSYFTSPSALINQHLKTWLACIQEVGASQVIFKAGFDKAIPEDAFLIAQENNLQTIVHFNSELPLARKFNDVAFIMDVYAKWGVKAIILGDQPNSQTAWPLAGWQYENLIDHFLDRFIPLAAHAVRIGLQPVFPPLQPGGDYWDTAFIELVLKGMKRRKLDSIFEHLMLSSYGYTFDKELFWGKGGPERWSISRPYLTPEGQQDQLGFNNYEWIQTQAERAIERKPPILILDAGNPGMDEVVNSTSDTLEKIELILLACRGREQADERIIDLLNDKENSIEVCAFDLDTIENALDGQLSEDIFKQVFCEKNEEENISQNQKNPVVFSHYLLLPAYKSGVSDVVLNKVRPFIKRFHPTVGFSLSEAAYAKKVSVFPDPLIFTDEQINNLRLAGCLVDILPESGIDIATSLQSS
ncbi:MAG: hypothetical protein ACK2TV_15140 [Anaerolineales bacterium]